MKFGVKRNYVKLTEEQNSLLNKIESNLEALKNPELQIKAARTDSTLDLDKTALLKTSCGTEFFNTAI